MEQIEEITLEQLCDAIYPLTIITDRYGGIYSGGNFIALCCYPDEVPSEIIDTDLTCKKYWDKYYNDDFVFPSIGVGNTLFEAVAQLFYECTKYDYITEDFLDEDD